MSSYKIHFGGGMGDIYQDILKSSTYRNLVDLKPEDTCDVLMICHNPHVTDFFKWHPKAPQINAFCPGYWGPDVNEIRRKERGLFQDYEENGPSGKMEPADFYPSPEDMIILRYFEEKKIVVIQATAGCMDRDIPKDQMDRMLKDLKNKGCIVIGIGKNYERGSRGPEFDYSDYPWVISLVDKLSIPGTIKLIQKASGVIACHSCVCLMAWHNRIPNILTLPKALNHINGIGKGENNQWTFGLFYPETQLVYLEDYCENDVDKLLLNKKFKKNKSLTTVINGIETYRLMNDPDAREYCRLVEQVSGGSTIVEIGSFDGGSLATLMPTIKSKNLSVIVGDKFDQPMTDDFNSRNQMLGSEESFRENISLMKLPFALILRTSEDVADWFKKDGRKASLIFVDADHSYDGVKKDVENLWPYLVDGGTMCGHDFYPNEHPGVVKYVLERFPGASILDGTGVWSVQKNKLRFAVISMNDDNYRPLADITWTGKKKYCKKHGYEAIFYPVGERTQESRDTEGHNHWFGFGKIQNILTTLDTGKYDWVFFSECDALITNHDVSLSDIVDDKYDILLSSNFDGINAGNLFVKNSDKSKECLRYILSQRWNYRARGYAEQQVLMDIVAKNMYPGLIRVMPQKMFNSHDNFLYDHYNIPKERRKDMNGNPGEWEPGDFQVHWSGFGLEPRLKFCEFYSDKIKGKIE